MTTDAKIGLLLALVFIVAITFVINGLPDFLSKTKTPSETVSYVNHYKQQPSALVGTSRTIAPALSHKPVINVITESPAAGQQSETNEIRYQAVLPAAVEAVREETIQNAFEQTQVVEVKAERTPVQPVINNIYVVQSGDSLAEISKKFYGPQQGNKLVNIEKIYKANKDKLNSMDSIQVGQELVIPSLENKTNALIKTGMFEKVTTARPVQKAEVSPKEAGAYIVKDSDSLWQIAAEKLGDGNRYKEIIQLNKSLIDNPDRLTVGMKLKLPAR